MAQPQTLTSYVAFLRGISPNGPNMTNDKLRSVFEALGFRNVRSVISSGNILFESAKKDIPALEREIEEALHAMIDVNSVTILRSREEIAEMVDKRPFATYVHTPSTYLTVTFLKHTPTIMQPTGSGILGVDKTARAIYAVADITKAKTPDLMRHLEQQYGKDITTRTWLTVLRVAKKMNIV